MSEPIIIVDNVHKSYLMGKEAVPALRGVSLEIEPGDFVCLMGPSGSGKTTLLNIIGGLDEASRGHVTVDGENLVALSENQLAGLRLHKMGFVFQNYNLLANFTAQENVEAPMVLAKIGRKERKERTIALLEKVGLADRAHHYPGELSGGQQQRVAIARALANRPADPHRRRDDRRSRQRNGLRHHGAVSRAKRRRHDHRLCDPRPAHGGVCPAADSYAGWQGWQRDQ